MPDPIQAPNVFRVILACLGETESAELAPRMFVHGAGTDVVMVDRRLVETLMNID